MQMRKNFQNEEIFLITGVIKLLKKFDFSNICCSNHKDYPEPDLINHSRSAQEYQPVLSAQKNNVTYYFELIGSNPDRLENFEKTLQNISKHTSNQWDTDFVLVTTYGNKEVLESWCLDRNLPISNIWEL